MLIWFGKEEVIRNGIFSNFVFEFVVGFEINDWD